MKNNKFNPSQIITQLTHGKRLDLSENRQKTIEIICQQLSEDKVKNLNLSKNLIGIELLKKLFGFINTASALEVLDLSKTNIKKEEVEIIKDFIKTSTLKVLILKNNNLDEENLKNLCLEIGNSKTLKIVYILNDKYTPLSNDMLGIIYNTLTSNTGLYSFDFCSSEVEDNENEITTPNTIYDQIVEYDQIFDLLDSRKQSEHLITKKIDDFFLEEISEVGLLDLYYDPFMVAFEQKLTKQFLNMPDKDKINQYVLKLTESTNVYEVKNCINETFNSYNVYAGDLLFRLNDEGVTKDNLIQFVNNNKLNSKIFAFHRLYDICCKNENIEEFNNNPIIESILEVPVRKNFLEWVDDIINSNPSIFAFSIDDLVEQCNLVKESFLTNYCKLFEKKMFKKLVTITENDLIQLGCEDFSSYINKITKSIEHITEIKTAFNHAYHWFEEFFINSNNLMKKIYGQDLKITTLDQVFKNYTKTDLKYYLDNNTDHDECAKLVVFFSYCKKEKFLDNEHYVISDLFSLLDKIKGNGGEYFDNLKFLFYEFDAEETQKICAGEDSQDPFCTIF